MERKIGIGMIGTGFGRRVQIPAFLACERVFIASIASGTIENARAAANDCAAGHYTASWRETIDRDDVDIVCITTPPNLHLEMVLAAIDACKHILCEKPMAMTVVEAVEMAEAVSGYSKLALIDHELRFQHGRLLCRDMIRSGKIGKIRSIRATFQAPHRGDVSLPWNWWSDASAGGGALGAIGSHVIDSFQWLLDAEIESVICRLETQIPERTDADGVIRQVTSDDRTELMFGFGESEFTSRATGLATISMTDGPRYKNQIDIFGDRGSISIDHNGGSRIAKLNENDWTEVPVDLGVPVSGVPDTGFSRGFTAFAPLLIDAVRTGRDIPNAATFGDGVRIQRVLDAARRSNSLGTWVAI